MMIFIDPVSVSRPPSNDLQGLINVLTLYGFDIVEFIFDFRGQGPASRIFS